MFDPRNNLANEVSAQLSVALRRSRLQHRHPAQRAARRSAELRPPGARPRQVLARRARLSGARRRGEPPLGHAAAAAGLVRPPPWPAPGSLSYNPATFVRLKRRHHEQTQKPRARPRCAALQRAARSAAARACRCRASRHSVAAAKPAESSLREVPVDLLRRGKYQPRVDMREESLAELADSIKAQGVVQPIVVRPVPNPHGHGRNPVRDRRRRAPLARRADGGPADDSGRHPRHSRRSRRRRRADREHPARET